MYSPSANSSPKYKNLASKHKQSPIEIKEKMRKNYKSKVQNCRGMLLDKFRGSLTEEDLSNTLTQIYRSMFTSPNETADSEETDILEEIKNELVHEELDWWLKEYERSQMDNFDWSCLDQEDNVICPVCQKRNLNLESNILSCSHCNITLKTQMTLQEIKKSILGSINIHSALCNSDSQFTVIPEGHESHVYLFCENCNEMKYII